MDKNSYALGMSIAHNMLTSGIQKIEFDDFMAGVKAVLTGSEPAVSFKEAGQLLDKYFAEIEAEQKAQAEAMSAAMREEGEAFLKMNAGKEGVTVLPSGLQYKVLEEGSGKKPKATDKVKCHYEGTLLNGVKFDSSYDRNEPAVFGLNQVIAGWTEGVQLMSEGSKYEFYIPYNLAYGEHGAPGAIPPYATLKFIVELIEVL
jgi:FKBP-type peptidyl-prolyl cis-trans isomerase FklB